MTDHNKKAVALSLTFSVIALALSLYASLSILNGTGAASPDVDTDFNARVAKAIDVYIADQQNRANSEAPRVAEKVPSNLEDDDAVRGSVSAAISLIEFSDFQCPYCSKFFTDTLGDLEKNYLETGKVKLVYRDFALRNHPEARPAAVAAECVRAERGDKAYYDFHDKIFLNQGNMNADAYTQYATLLGAGASSFQACITSGRFDAELDRDFEDGQKSGVTGTPGFVLLMPKNEAKVEALKAQELIQQGQYIIQYVETEDGQRMGLRISGAHPYSTFEKAIQVGL